MPTDLFCNLILGGARSGKTRLAENRAIKSSLTPIYIATATADDEEMSDRIARHQADRLQSNTSWINVEQPLKLAEYIDNTLTEYGQTGCSILVDCLTLWLSNCLHHECWEAERSALIDLLTNRLPTQHHQRAHIYFVSNETGLGIVPMGQLSRRFVDESGFLHQELASLCDQVTLVVAGIPTELKTT